MSLRSAPVLIGIVVAVAAGCVRLGVWQLGRLGERRAANAVAQARRAEPPLHLPQTGGGPNPVLDNRRIVARGAYDPAGTMIIRGRIFRETPGVHVVTPLKLEGTDTAVLVNRGFVPAADAMSVATESLSIPDPVVVRGLAFAIPVSEDRGGRLVRAERTTWRRLDLAELRATLPYPILEVYVLESPEGADRGFPRRLAPPELSDGPHLSYAVQWFSFAAIAVIGGAALLIQERKRERPSGI